MNTIQIYHGILPILCFHYRIEQGEGQNLLYLKYDVSIDPLIHRCIDAALRVIRSYACNR